MMTALVSPVVAEEAAGRGVVGLLVGNDRCSDRRRKSCDSMDCFFELTLV
jgi:hypothetical protein